MVRYTASDVEKANASGLPAEGKYLGEIDKSDEKYSQSGDPMFNVAFKDVSTGHRLCFDTIMMGGRGMGIGHKKLLILGVVAEGEKEFDVEAHQLLGKRAVLTLKHETFNGKTNAKPDFKANAGFGYEPESAWVVAVDDDNPF